MSCLCNHHTAVFRGLKYDMKPLFMLNTNIHIHTLTMLWGPVWYEMYVTHVRFHWFVHISCHKSSGSYFIAFIRINAFINTHTHLTESNGKTGRHILYHHHQTPMLDKVSCKLFPLQLYWLGHHKYTAMKSTRSHSGFSVRYVYIYMYNM